MIIRTMKNLIVEKKSYCLMGIYINLINLAESVNIVTFLMPLNIIFCQTGSN
jgi:hypothetical protein